MMTLRTSRPYGTSRSLLTALTGGLLASSVLSGCGTDSGGPETQNSAANSLGPMNSGPAGVGPVGPDMSGNLPNNGGSPGMPNGGTGATSNPPVGPQGGTPGVGPAVPNGGTGNTPVGPVGPDPVGPGNGGNPPFPSTGGTPNMGGGGGTPSNGGGGGQPPGNGGSGNEGGGGGETVNCTITVDSTTTSDDISTVGIVEWSTDLANITEADIEFGLDTTYGFTADVDLDEPNYRTLLLGMKELSDYHFRIVARTAEGECVGPDNMLTTGAKPNNLPNIQIDTPNPDDLAGGFLITSTYQSGPAYILDADGDFVWWFSTNGVGSDPSGEITRARMSYDGKHMWVLKGNVPEGSGAKVIRVGMDGSDPQDLTSIFGDVHHDLTVLPDGRVIYLAYDGTGCDDIREYSPDGTSRVVINAGDALGETSCHCNALQYSASDETIIFSELNSDNYVKTTLDGTVVWILGPNGPFTGDGASWTRQHGLDILGEDRLLFFNNGAMQGGSSLAIEVTLDLEAETATRVWEYNANPTISSQIMGDVQRLHNGNTLVTYSIQGTIHEVDADGALVQSLSWPIGGAVGYSMKRQSLYGPPPK